MTSTLLAIALLSNGSTARTVNSATPSENDFSWRSQLSPGSVIELRGVLGSIHAERATGNEVQVSATKHARDSDPSSVKIEVVEHREGVTICAVYPSGNGNRKNECTPGGGQNNVSNNDVIVDFTVRVPASVSFIGATVNGSVEARNLHREVGAYTVNGDIRASSDSFVDAKNINGSIEVKMGSTAWPDMLALENINGTIELCLPTGASTRVTAETFTGSVSTDFPLTITAQFISKRLTGSIGAGGRELKLKSTTGDINLRRC